MSSYKVTTDKILQPILHTSKIFLVSAAVLLSLMAVGAYAYLTQLTQGLMVTGLRDWGVGGGIPWGAYISTFVWYVGIAHGGIAISASIRIMKLDEYKPLARMAELLTILSLAGALITIIVDSGRPDRVFNFVVYYLETVGDSPLIWDFTVVLAYFVLSAIYLGMTMREDVIKLMSRLPSKYKLLYRTVTFGHKEGEKEKVEQIAWWLALSLVILMALLSGGVIPWIFGLMPSQAGWFGAIQGPYFLTGALTSAVAGVIVVASIAVKVFHWEDLIPEKVFKGLSKMLLILTIIYLWFILHEHITAQYAGPTAEKTISDALLYGSLSTIFLPVLAILILSVIFLAIQTLSKAFSLKATLAVSIILLLTFWVKRLLIVMPSLLYPRLTLYPVGSYTPTWVEYTIIIATVSFVALAYMIFMKIFPIMEIKEGEQR